MSDVSIYNRCLNDIEVSALYDVINGPTAGSGGGGGGSAAGYVTNVGDGTNTTYTITHGLGSRDVIVQLYSNSGNYEAIDCEIRRTSTTTATLIFGSIPTTDQYRVVITPSTSALAYKDVQSFGYGGTLATFSGTGKYVVYQDCTIAGIHAAVGTAPAGASIIIDVNKNGTTIFSTQANRPTITTGGSGLSGWVTNMDIASLSAGEYITIDIDQVGSPTTEGADLTVQVVMV
jgi:hypothetical protein